jgi:hypothetical protein
MLLSEIYQNTVETIDESYEGLYKNVWVGTPYETYYKLSSKTKGTFGERQMKKIFLAFGHLVEKSTNVEHDMLVDGKKVEIKFSLAPAPTDKTHGAKMIEVNGFIFNHIGLKKDWEKLFLCGVNPSWPNPFINLRKKTAPRQWEECNIYVINKADLVYFMEKNPNNPIFKRQQGGKHGGNDDYMISGRSKFNQLVKLPFVRKYTGPKSL